MLKLYKYIFVLILTFLLLGEVSHAQVYNTITDKGYFSTLDDYYVENDRENKKVNDFIEEWTKENKSHRQTEMYLKIRDLICEKASYRAKLKIDYSAYGLIRNGKACCMGYTLLTKRFFDHLNIPNYLIHDLTENHLYNLARLDGIWSHIDITTYDREKEFMERWWKENIILNRSD